MEEWKDILGYEGEYQVSNYGSVRSLDRYIKSKSKLDKEFVYFKRGKNLIPELGSLVYPYVVYYLKKDGKRYYNKAHRLVAKAFISNPENKKVVNHIDSNPRNNHVDNLDWVTHSENAKHAYDNGRIDITKAIEASRESRIGTGKIVYQYTINKKPIAQFNSVRSAAKITNSDENSISKVCRGVINIHNNYFWSYELL
jgi:hypothetical protein